MDELGRTVSLRDPVTAAVLAWLVPGLGHLYQGRKHKALLYSVCILGTFFYGCYLGSSRNVGYARVVYASFRPGDSRMAYLCQLGAGLPAMPALIQSMRVRQGKSPLFFFFMAPPRLGSDNGDPPTLNRIHKELHAYFELGSLYTMTAGLLNILVVFDAFLGPAFPPTEDEQSRKKRHARDRGRQKEKRSDKADASMEESASAAEAG
ncbi:MAG: hypothetical protein D6741_03380 [Planctomycetota bacterium]|nr:MAG: hypothetical protein D6741_03380 [Planctomycetota bacterium]